MFAPPQVAIAGASPQPERPSSVSTRTIAWWPMGVSILLAHVCSRRDGSATKNTSHPAISTLRAHPHEIARLGERLIPVRRDQHLVLDLHAEATLEQCQRLDAEHHALLQRDR